MRIYCVDCPFETDGETEARNHRITFERHATTHTIQPALKEFHPWLFAELKP